MDPATPTPTSPEPTNPTPPVTETVVETPKVKDNHWMTIAAMAVFVLLALSAVAFLYYQNQQLKAMVVSYQKKPSPTPLATSIPTLTPGPTTSGEATASPVASASATPTASPTPTN